ncbi:MAG: hypothetical protein HY758_03230 [Nitrospirae bacterium]|nr:hypothetical protein [Nitrospirota bacterium]
MSRTNNGKWIVVLASGPTGPIDTINQQFLGRSDQPLKIFALDLKTGTSAGTPVYPSISTSFAGSLLNSTQDTDIDYQDDVLYIPYVSKADDGTWTDGGVMRLLTGENADPDTWKGSIVIDGIGPLTSSVARLQQKSGCYTDTPSGSQEGCMWLYFATGRYYYVLASDDTADVDDPENQRSLFGIKEPCYSASMFPVPDTECDSTAAVTTNVTDIADVPSEATVNTKDFKGWQIDLEAAGTYTYGGVSSDFSAERVITNPLASTTGIVFFTTYKPYTDVCSLGGKSFIWATRYNTGGAAGALLKGKALLQVSTGSIEQVDLEDAFEENNPSDPDYDPDKPANEDSQGDRRSGAMEGVPPTDQGLSILVPPPGVKRTIHIRER